MLRYDRYRDSGVSTISQVPFHWEVNRLGPLLSPVSIKDHSHLTLLSITRELGVIERSLDDDENHNYIPDDLSGYKLLRKGQFGMNKMKAWQGSYGVSAFDGIVSPAYYVFKFNKPINPQFFHWAIRSKRYISYFGEASDGVRIGQWDLSKERMKRIPFFTPPLPEQTAIAAFLDRKTAAIDRAIAQQERLIDLLRERKQILIQRAVTRGLDAGVALKDSGVEWIGMIPAHWEIQRAKYLVDEVDDRSLTGNEELLSVSHLTGVTPRADKTVTMFQSESYIGSKLCQENDIVINTMWAWMGALGIAGQTGIISPSYGVYRVRENNYILPYYLNALLTHKKYIAHYNRISTGLHTSRLRLYPPMVLGLPILLPPAKEQKDILQAIEEVSTKVNQAIHLQTQKIAKLTEYRATLIDAAVTGKIRVVHHN